MTTVTGYVVDAAKTTTSVSSYGYTYISGAMVSFGGNFDSVSSNGFFSISNSDPLLTTIVITRSKYGTTEVAISGISIVTMWKNKSYA